MKCQNFLNCKVYRNFAASILAIILSLITNSHVFAQCNKAQELWNQREDLRNQLAELEKAEPFIEQFQQVKQTIEIVRETLQETSKDLGEVKGKIDKLLGETKAQNNEMRKMRQWARSVYSNQDWEPRNAPRGKQPITISKGLGKAKDWMSEMEKDLSKFVQAMNVLERAVQAREGRPSEQLKAFQEYFKSIRETIGKYAEEIPLIGIFMKFFTFYEQAIGLIAANVEIIEKEYSRKDEMLRQLGPQFNNVRYHWPQTTPSERLARQKNNLRQEIERIEQRLEPLLKNCAEEFKKAPKDPDNLEALARELSRSRTAAEKRCGPGFGVTSEHELVNKRNDLLEKAGRVYNRTKYWPIEYGTALTAAEEIDWIEKRHLDRKFVYITKAKRELAELQKETDSVENKFQLYRSGQLTLNTKDQVELNDLRKNKKSALEWKRKTINEDSLAIAAIDKSVKDLLDAQQKLEDFRICIKEWMEGLAKNLNWDPYWLSYFHRDLYQQPFLKTFQVINVLFPETVLSGVNQNTIVAHDIEISWKGNIEFPVRLLWSNTYASVTGNYKPETRIVSEYANPVIISKFYGFWGFITPENLVYELRLEETKTEGRKTQPYQVPVKVIPYR